MTIPDVIQPVPALFVSRTRADVAAIQHVKGCAEPFEDMWIEAHIMFYNEAKKVSGRVGVFGYN